MDEIRPNLDLPSRVAYCAKLIGSKTKLAYAIGVSKPAVTKYLLGKAKPRPKVLLKMAHSAGVSAEWLEFGAGNPEVSMSAPGNEGTATLQSLYNLVRQVGGLDEAFSILSQAVHKSATTSGPNQQPNATPSPNQTESQALPSGFTSRITEAIRDLGGTDKVSELTGIPPNRVISLCSGAVPTMSELNTLGSCSVISLDWLIKGSGPDPEPANRAYYLNHLMSRMKAFDIAARPPRVLPDHVYVGPTEYTSIEGLAKFWLKTYEKVTASNYTSVEVPDESMQPLLDPGDIVLVDTRKRNITHGVYLIQSPNGKVVVKAWVAAEKTFACYLADKDNIFELNPAVSIGSAVWVFKPISLRNIKQSTS